MLGGEQPTKKHPTLYILNYIKEQEQQTRKHLNSSMLPKICKTTMLEQKKKKSSKFFDNDTKIVISENDQREKKQKMAIVISDYLENFRNKQKGSILAISNQKQKIAKKPIQVQGISHSKFVKQEYSKSLQQTRLKSQQKQKRLRLKANKSFIERIKTESKVSSNKSLPRVRSQSISDPSHLSDLKSYILRAKKSVIDCRQKFNVGHKSQQKHIRVSLQ